MRSPTNHINAKPPLKKPGLTVTVHASRRSRLFPVLQNVVTLWIAESIGVSSFASDLAKKRKCGLDHAARSEIRIVFSMGESWNQDIGNDD